jgi:hypothetical protein
MNNRLFLKILAQLHGIQNLATDSYQIAVIYSNITKQTWLLLLVCAQDTTVTNSTPLDLHNFMNLGFLQVWSTPEWPQVVSHEILTIVAEWCLNWGVPPLGSCKELAHFAMYRGCFGSQLPTCQFFACKDEKQPLLWSYSIPEFVGHIKY